jgi:hypothetical protein
MANEISGINKNTLPSELLPLNTIQLARGLLNYTVMQSRLSWIFPYWAEKQYDYHSYSFIPRSHLGLSMNITERNWTAVGSPECNVEPIVDPRGLVTPFVNGWSIDVWMSVDNNIIVPAKQNNVQQALIINLPVVETKIHSNENHLITQVYTLNSELFVKAEIKTDGYNNASPTRADTCVIFSIRPFNPEGISLIYSISFNHDANTFIINNKEQVAFNKTPSFVYCSTFEEGDSFHALTKSEQKFSARCEYGMASAVAVFKCSEEENPVLSKCSLTETNKFTDSALQESMFPSSSGSLEYWNNLLKKGTVLESPEEKINSLFKFSAATLLMLLDKNSITPGPFTYHQFWIRDAAFMLNALDKIGYSALSLPVIKRFLVCRDKHGYFRSQKGEWDSNGEVLWSTYQHVLISGNYKLLESIYSSLLKGVNWIDKARLRRKKNLGTSYFGLLPAGLSAEHLGLVDHYYWDNFWSLAGIRSFESISKILNKTKNLDYISSLIYQYQNELNISIENCCNEFNEESIPASCTRGIDCGMIGSVSALYPTQLFKPINKRIMATLDTIYTRYFYKGMFFQNFIHSGMNAYLTLQVAHAYLYSNNRERFWEILSSVISNSTNMLNFPEAIHPFTGGGSMGDGHHGWAAAEIVLALRDAFVFERFIDSSNFIELVLLAGIPAVWFEGIVPFSITNVPVVGGSISIKVIPSEKHMLIKLAFVKSEPGNDVRLKIILPVQFEKGLADEVLVNFLSLENNSFVINSSVKEIKLWRKQKKDYTVSSSIAFPISNSL